MSGAELCGRATRGALAELGHAVPDQRVEDAEIETKLGLQSGRIEWVSGRAIGLAIVTRSADLRARAVEVGPTSWTILRDLANVPAGRGRRLF